MINSWIKKDLKYIWHPYTQMKDCRVNPPILINKAKGVKLFTASGKFYYDTISSWWCNVHGHNHPAIRAAIKKQLNKLDHVLFAGFTHQSAIILAEKLITIAPKNLTKVFFSDNGSTAVEVAMKMSLQYWQNIGKQEKTKFICLDKAYHGDTIGAMSVSGESIFNGKFKSLMFTSFKIPSPDCFRCPLKLDKNTCAVDCTVFLERLLKRKHKQIAALILEPLVLAAGGMIIYPEKYLRKAVNLARQYNTHLILDEVATGFGRTGKMFACEHADVSADFMCLSKGLTSGTLPLAVTLTTDKIYKAFYADFTKLKTFYHGHTYTANPIACSAACACLDIFEQENSLARIQPLIGRLNSELNEFRQLNYVGDVRIIGLIAAIELVKNKKTRQGFDFNQRVGFKIYLAGLKKNLILRPLGNIIYFYLPLCLNQNQLSDILARTKKVITHKIRDKG